MKNAWKKVASLMLAAALGVTACPVALAEEAPVQPELQRVEKVADATFSRKQIRSTRGRPNL